MDCLHLASKPGEIAAFKLWKFRLAESNPGCRWTPDGQALTFILKGKTVDNLWLQPLDGSPPQALTDFNSGEIYNYAFSRNGQRLFLARGYSIRDVLLIQEFR